MGRKLGSTETRYEAFKARVLTDWFKEHGTFRLVGPGFECCECRELVPDEDAALTHLRDHKPELFRLYSGYKRRLTSRGKIAQ